MEFGFHEGKRLLNKEKHGIDFFAVGPCFTDERRIVWRDNRRAYGEERFNMLALLGDRVHAVTFTQRGEVVWLISARKANDRETLRYERDER